MYRITIELYATQPRARVNALFEQELHGKTQKLANTGLWLAVGDLFENCGHAETLGELDGVVRILVQMLLARLESEIPGVSDTL